MLKVGNTGDEILQILDVILKLAHAGGGGVREVVNHLLCCFLFCQLLQLGEGLSLSCCKADDKLSVYPSSLLSGKIQLLQLGQAGADPSVANHPFHLGS